MKIAVSTLTPVAIYCLQFYTCIGAYHYNFYTANWNAPGTDSLLTGRSASVFIMC